jgi:hypothetical protein
MATNTVMVFKKTSEGLKRVDIEDLGGIDNVMRNINKDSIVSIVNKTNRANKTNKKNKKNKIITITLNKPQFIYSYLTDDALIDLLISTNNDFTIYFTNGKRIEIDTIDMFRRESCDCINCKKIVINEDPDILNKMTDKCFIEVKFDNKIFDDKKFNDIIYQHFYILEILADNITQLPSYITYPTFLPPMVKYSTFLKQLQFLDIVDLSNN